MPPAKPVPATLDDFELGDEVAWGSLATIIDAVYKKNNKHYALKVLNKAQLVKKKVIRSALVEKDALIRLGTRDHMHPGVIRLHHCFQDSTHLYFALDLATNGDLKAVVLKLGSISLNCSRYYTAQLVDAVRYLHESGVTHRDIKPENVLLDSDMRIKLADFGCAYIGDDMDTPRTNTFVGTAAYISPELLARSVSNPTSPDLWAIGCTVFFFLFGGSPFAAATDYLTMKRVKALDYTLPQVCDPDAADLIRRLLVLDPHERLGVEPKSSVEELCRHPFFIGGTERKTSKSENWNVLWTAPAPEIAVGPYRSRPQESSSTDDLWAGFESLHVTSES
ncbi:AGC/PDK1 protein kinase [Gymnopilus junonius]|uniref:non-specific serine/threonine protein kinase n=1 Tax=Gymnopilus junonius TaxID=109634 RepID=A0A9P5NH43_GYMJU|nr:AGC/PDK1 protein kinase [Gymnopilus junonius]